MKISTACAALALSAFAAPAFAQETPDAYRQALLSRPLSAGEANFCRAKSGDQSGYDDCQVTLNFLKDINRNQSPSDHVCPQGASIQYAGNPANQDKITKRCT